MHSPTSITAGKRCHQWSAFISTGKNKQHETTLVSLCVLNWPLLFPRNSSSPKYYLQCFCRRGLSLVITNLRRRPKQPFNLFLVEKNYEQVPSQAYLYSSFLDHNKIEDILFVTETFQRDDMSHIRIQKSYRQMYLLLLTLKMLALIFISTSKISLLKPEVEMT